MKKNIIVISLTFILGLASCSFTSSNFDQTDKDKLLMQLISYVLDQGHFVEKQINSGDIETAISTLNIAETTVKDINKVISDEFVTEKVKEGTKTFLPSGKSFKVLKFLLIHV